MVVGKTRFCFASLLVIAAATGMGQAVQTEQPASASRQWIELFNGIDLQGWTQRGGKAVYTVEDRTIVGSSVPNSPNSFLCTEKEYGDFELQLEFLVHPELNSGIQIRSQSKPDYRNGVVHGYQVEIDPSDRAWSAGIYDESRRGWLDNPRDNRAARHAFQQGQWNSLRILAVGDHIRTWLNGVAAADLHDTANASGFIALQVHGVGDREDAITVRWRNIRLSLLEGLPADDNAARSRNESASTGSEPKPTKLPIFPEPDKIAKLAGGFSFTEGPAVGPDNKIYFNDVPKSVTHVFDPQSGQVTIFRRDTGRSNGLYFSPNDALISCEGKNRQVTWRWNDRHRVLAKSFEGKRLNSPNDLVLDNSGGIYFTDPRYGDRTDMEMDVEGVYYITQDSKLTRIIDNLTRPNGIILSPDEKTLYVADQAAGQIHAWDVAGNGQVNNQRKLADFGSDGMSIDADGNLYLTWSESIIVISPAGEELARLKTPEPPSNCELVGNTLYITARTGFYSVATGSTGLIDW
jgi:sugar lactone lactonase YvrE